jgi:hypothetical protein
MAEQGGYQKPENPAMVSGPGAFSQRTDGQPGVTPTQAARYIGGGEWGTNEAFNEDVVGQAPMAAAESMSAPSAPALDLSSVPGLFDPTQKPDEPITAGFDFGEGDGPESLEYYNTMQQQNDADLQALRQLMPVLKIAADKSGSSYATRLLLKKLNATIGPYNNE